MIDPDHWLWRLSAHGWLEAANRELEQASQHVGLRRTSVTHARRAAGMALNGVLVAMAERGWSPDRCASVWGRSYIDHLRILADGPNTRGPFDDELGERCRTLLEIPVMPPTGLVRLATRKDQQATEALVIATEIARICARVIGS